MLIIWISCCVRLLTHGILKFQSNSTNQQGEHSIQEISSLQYIIDKQLTVQEDNTSEIKEPTVVYNLNDKDIVSDYDYLHSDEEESKEEEEEKDETKSIPVNGS